MRKEPLDLSTNGDHLFSFDIGSCKVHIRRAEDDSVKFVTEDGDGETLAFEMRDQKQKIGPYELHRLVRRDACSYDDPWCFMENEVLLPKNKPSVIQLEDGRLWCRKCKCYVENTANSEMRKDGCYAYSHICPPNSL